VEIEVVDFMESWMENGNGRRKSLVVKWGRVPIETKRKKWID
jgi:hypothetical protein